MLFCTISCVAWFSDVRGREAKGTANDLGRLRIKLLVVQSNFHTLVVLSFFFCYRLRQKELEKNWTDQQNWAMNLNHIFVKRLRGFWRWRVKKIVCLFRFQNMWPHQSNSPTKAWGRQPLKIFWRQQPCWLVKYVNTNLPWSQFLTLVIQSFLKNLGRERIVFPAQPVFLCFQRCFRLWSRRYCVNWSLVFPGTDSKLELRLNKIQYLNKDAVNVKCSVGRWRHGVCNIRELKQRRRGRQRERQKALGLD